MRALMLIFLAFVLAFLGAVGGVLYSQGLLKDDGVMLLVRTPAPAPEEPAAETPTPASAALAAELQAELAALESAKAELERERGQLAVERDALDRQRAIMAAELAAVETFRQSVDQDKAVNTKALSQMLANMDAAAAALIVEKLPEDTAVAVLLAVKQRESGAILEELPPTVAATLSERIVEVRRSQTPTAG